MGRLHTQEEKTKISESCKKRGIGKWMIGRKLSSEIKLKIKISNIGKHTNKRPDQEGEKHHFWKGEEVSYRSLHKWVGRKLGKANKCMVNPSHKSTRYHWANISHEYKRDLTDWIQMCPSCNCKDRIGRRISP